MPYRRSLAISLLCFTVYCSPAVGQDAQRVEQLEAQIRQLTGQVEELTFTVNRLSRQAGTRKPEAELLISPVTPIKQPIQPRVAENSGGIEVIEEAPLAGGQLAPQAAQQQASVYGDDGVVELLAPAPNGLTKKKAADPNDGGFQGQVLVAPGGEAAVGETSSTAVIEDTETVNDGIETVSLAAETPESLYKKSDEALLRRQFGEADAGFSNFLKLYPQHSLAGSAQYWLGETHYAQGDYRGAAQNFLQGYQNYPKSRRAPDSLLKLGLALNKLGQKEQACAALGNVGGEYPKAVEARKRAQAEFKRAGC